MPPLLLAMATAARGAAAGVPKPTFDETGRLRVLDTVRSQQTEELEREARTIVSGERRRRAAVPPRPPPPASRRPRPAPARAELQEFSSTVTSVVENLGAQAAVIEAEKHKAIGFRALAEQEKQARARRARELQASIDERAEELARLVAELESLQRVDAEQRELILSLAEG